MCLYLNWKWTVCHLFASEYHYRARERRTISLVVEFQSSPYEANFVRFHTVVVPPAGIRPAWYEKDDRLPFLPFLVAFLDELRELPAIWGIHKIGAPPVACQAVYFEIRWTWVVVEAKFTVEHLVDSLRRLPIHTLRTKVD